jgi:5'-nucleotidase
LKHRILVTNDDGVDSEGLDLLARALAELGAVTVVAPDRDRSGVGHALTIHDPVRVREVQERGVRTFACTGTPADCIVIGAFDLCGGLPALVVSGINRGANLGDDVNYSGTVAAAIEGALVGVPSIAISLAATWPEHSREHHWQSAVEAAVGIAGDLLRDGLAPRTYLNVNVPNHPPHELNGLRWTRQGRKKYGDRIDPRRDPRGGAYYWIWGSFDPAQIEDGTDLAAIRDRYVSVTPMSVDRTDFSSLETPSCEIGIVP